jgi:phosphoglycolate phosphatase
MYPGVMEGLAALAQQGLALACVTNKAARFTLPLLERTRLKNQFKTIVCGDEVERGKPEPLCYLLACERLGVAPSEAVVIGDSGNDVLAARAAGIAVVCVPYGYNEGRPVASLAPDAIVRDLLDAARWVKARAAR